METELPANFYPNQLGRISIATEVFELIVRLATEKVPGIIAMNSSFMDELLEYFGRKAGRGVKVEVEDAHVFVDIAIVVKYGFSIPTLIREIQFQVREAIKGMTGMDVRKMDFHVIGIEVADDSKPSR